VLARVLYLFKDRPELILSFNKFLPAGYKIEIIKHPMGFHVTKSKSKIPKITSTLPRMH